MKRTITFLLISSLALCSAFAWEPNGRRSIFSVAYPIPLYWEKYVEQMDWSLYRPVESTIEEPPLEQQQDEPDEVVEEANEDFQENDDTIVIYAIIVMFLLNLCMVCVITTQAYKKRRTM